MTPSPRNKEGLQTQKWKQKLAKVQIKGKRKLITISLAYIYFVPFTLDFLVSSSGLSFFSFLFGRGTMSSKGLNKTCLKKQYFKHVFSKYFVIKWFDILKQYAKGQAKFSEDYAQKKF